MIDLSTTYLGLQLNNPLVPSSSPLMQHVDNIKRMEDAGASAVVLHSLFEEQIVNESLQLDQMLDQGTYSFAEALTTFPEMQTYNMGADGYLEHIRKVKQAVAMPVIASLNGVSLGRWIDYAKKIQDAGADALELNMYYLAADTHKASGDVEKMQLDLLRAIKANLKIPVAVKLGAAYTAFANFCKQLDDAGANGFVIFNRFYQPDLDLENLDVVSNLDLSASTELRQRLRWVAILYGHIHADMAITGGVHTAEDVVKCMMAGAKVAMTTSALLRDGIDTLKTILMNLTTWMEKHDYASIKQMQGSMSQKSVAYPAAFERANYIKVLKSYRV